MANIEVFIIGFIIGGFVVMIEAIKMYEAKIKELKNK